MNCRGNETPRRNLYLLAHRPEEPHANQSDGHCRRPYWTAAAFVIGRVQRVSLDGRTVCCVRWGITNCVIFATLQNLFFTATVQDNFSVWMSRIYYKWGRFHEVSSHQAFSCSRWSQDERQPRRCILERIEGHRPRAPSYLVGASWHDRF